MPAFHAFSLIMNGIKIGGSAIGAPHEIEASFVYVYRKHDPQH